MTELAGARARCSGLTERSWVDLTERGLPDELAHLRGVLGRHNGRPIPIFSTPMLEAGLVAAGLAVPFEHEDAIIVDPFLLDRPRALRNVVARELARIMHPRWRDPSWANEEQVEEFVSVLTPLLLSRHPRTPAEIDAMVELTMDLLEPARRQRTHAPKDGPWHRNTTAPSPPMIA